jgi:hypothetical protein
MRGRAAVRIELTDAERAELEGRARRRKTARADAIRADIVLLAAAGTSNVGIAERFGVTRVTVTTWQPVRAALRCPEANHKRKAGWIPADIGGRASR